MFRPPSGIPNVCPGRYHLSTPPLRPVRDRLLVRRFIILQRLEHLGVRLLFTGQRFLALCSRGLAFLAVYRRYIGHRQFSARLRPRLTCRVFRLQRRLRQEIRLA